MKRVLVCLVAACHGGGTAIYTGDAPAGFDAPSLDGPGSAIAITIRAGDAGTSGVTVVFTNADGSPVATAQTDDTGTASQVMAAGGYVTVVDGSLLTTFAGVQPGDHLHLDTPSAATASDTIIVPLAGSDTGYTAVALLDGVVGSGSLVAGSASASGAIEVGSGGDLLVAATTDAGELAATLWHPGFSPSGTGSDDLTTTDSFVPVGSATYTYANAPSGQLLLAQVALVTDDGAVRLETQSIATAGSGSATLALPAPEITDANVRFAVTTSLASTSTRQVIDWGSAAGDYALDFSGLLMPTIGGLALDLSTVELTWAEGSGAAPDLSLGTMWFDGDPDVSAWRIVAPHAAGALQLPPIPGHLPSTAPVQFELILAQVPGGYDAVRETAFALSPAFISGASGRSLVAAADQ